MDNADGTDSAVNSSIFKKLLVIVHDLAAIALAFLGACYIRFEGFALQERLKLLPVLLPGFVIWGGLVCWAFHLYKSRWRFASLPDLNNIVRASLVLAASLLLIDYILVSPQFFGFYYFGKITIAVYLLLQIFFLGGSRLLYRYFRYARSRNTIARDVNTPTLLLGRSSDIEVVLRAIEAGTVQKIQPRGVLSYRDSDLGQSIRGIPVLGDFTDLERVVQEFAERGTVIRRLVATPSALNPEAHPEQLLARARRLGLPLSRMSSLGEGMRGAEILPLEIEDLLLRPSVEIDRPRLEGFIKGKRILVTGGGGSIGSEMCLRIAAFGARSLMVIESSEPSLHHILENPVFKEAEIELDGVIADVRDRSRMIEIVTAWQPDVVIHAAALKHVPYLEKDWAEGIKTNVFGSINVADAALAAKARALVMISTDKAIEPVSMLGVTKRFAEMYAQALDAEGWAKPAERASMTRLIAVRFGNVLGSVGSVVPKFKAQIARGGPLTVTHPDMVRYFMTTREAVDLVLTAASHADGDARALISPQDESASVYVLKMGQPVRIYELAERMIRFAGFEPNEDIDIVVTGARPGERLNEILFAHNEPRVQTGIDGVMAAKPAFVDRAKLMQWIDRLARAAATMNRKAAEKVFEEAIPDFKNREIARVPGPPAPQAQPAPQPAAASQG